MRDADLLDAVSMEYLVEPSIHPLPGIMELTQESSWMDSIVVYLKNEACVLRLKAARYALYDNKLYRKGYFMPLLKCETPSKVKYIIRDIHKGACENHTGGQFLTFKVLRQGYYCPTMKVDYMGHLDLIHNPMTRFTTCFFFLIIHTPN